MTTYYLDNHDNILCSTCGVELEDAIKCTNDMKRTLTCHECKESIPFIGQVDIHVRPVKDEFGTIYKFFRKIGSRKYELHSDYLDYGFKRKAHAERRAREIEQSA